MRLEDDSTLLEDLGDSDVLSEARYKSKTGRNPPPPPDREEVESDSDEESCELRKYSQMEDTSVRKIRTDRNSNDNFLVGRKLCFAWSDLKGTQKVVYGKVAECEYNPYSEQAISCKVVYSSASREVVNAIENECGAVVPESQMLGPQLVFGGCMRYEEQSTAVMERLTDFTRLPFYWTWINPDLRHGELAEGEDGRLFPRLTVILRGYRLVLNVKPSTIPNAGNGVFLSCRPMVDFNDDEEGVDDSDDIGDGQEQFELNAGELIDLGIYAPFRIQDKKPEAAFYVKNFIHTFKCEEWSFDLKGSRDPLDITDDVTGDLHAIAKAHIHAYVNETDKDDQINIQAVHDAEGSVHYLLGHAKESQEKFVIPTDGSEIELFINYGAAYEKVRVRKGYSFLPEEERGDILEELDNEDISDVNEMDNFQAAEVEAAANYLFGLFSTEDSSKFAGDVIERALTCAAVLQRRAQRLILEPEDNEMPSEVNLKRVLILSRRLVYLILDMVKDKEGKLKALQAGSNFDGLLKEILERQYSPEQLSRLGDIME